VLLHALDEVALLVDFCAQFLDAPVTLLQLIFQFLDVCRPWP
jgi:hypothetical protein